ncbi:MAG TPA: FG-GAP-like repeat-containing protein [candidate division Zixibacteria bacterium]|nr:FG-GAP-like repeat-containing protein [candidate division Zixibacteria bacterium]
MKRTVLLFLFSALMLLIELTSGLGTAKASNFGPSAPNSVQHTPSEVFNAASTNETHWTGFSGAQGVAVGDLDNDSLKETAIAEGSAGRVTILRGLSNGTTIVGQLGVNNPFGVAIGDFNNDGRNEIAITEPDSDMVLVSKSDGSIVKQFFLPTGSKPTGVTIGDFNNDGKNEIAIAQSGLSTVIVCTSDGSVVKQFSLTGSQPEGVTIGDFNNDGKNEIAFADSTGNSVYVLRSDGTQVKTFSGLGGPMGVAIGDFNNDGKNEIAITETNPVGKVTVYADNGTTVAGNWNGRNNPTSVAIGDVNNDGKNELAFTEVSQLTIIQELKFHLTILSPENKAYNVSNTPLDFETDLTPSWMGYSLDGQPNATIPGNTTLTGLQDGQHSIIVYANDTSGNSASSNPGLFEVDTTPPSITNVVQNPPANNVGQQNAVNINATVTDATSGVKQVLLNYSVDNGIWTDIPMTNNAGSTWNASIPALPFGTYVNYTIAAEDNANNSITTEKALGYQFKYQVVPEFPTLLLLTLLMTTTAAAVIVHKRKQLKQSSCSRYFWKTSIRSRTVFTRGEVSSSL